MKLRSIKVTEQNMNHIIKIIEKFFESCTNKSNGIYDIDLTYKQLKCFNEKEIHKQYKSYPDRNDVVKEYNEWCKEYYIRIINPIDMNIKNC